MDIALRPGLFRTTGFAALMRIQPDILNSVDSEQSDIPVPKVFGNYLEKVPLNDDDFTSEKFKPGSSGEGEFVKILRSGMFDKAPIP